ncbi:hypothetical protein [Aquimarina pacifica]|uniref:hypothetical protein n=1 Tax=Aquimarina pacifica TaxID=1296415 RepID=UPI00047215C1|nr:hypothetical protein [Aquimarina pacifica]
MKFTKIILFLLFTITGLFSSCNVNVFKYSDLRPTGYTFPNDTLKAKLLIKEMTIAHKNHLWDDIKTYQVQFEEESFGFFGRRSSPFKELKMDFSLNYIPKTFNGLMEIKSGKEKGDLWGIKDGKTYKRNKENIVFQDNKSYKFSMNTFQYFIEFPNRIIEANIIDYLGTKNIDGKVTEGVIVSWNKLEPQENIDQYIIWLDAKTKRIVLVEYTVREKIKFARGSAYFSNYKEFNGFLLPTKISSKSNIKKNGYLHIKKINNFTPNVLTIDYLKPSK